MIINQVFCFSDTM